LYLRWQPRPCRHAAGRAERARRAKVIDDLKKIGFNV
jgi:hypothetical protein